MSEDSIICRVAEKSPRSVLLAPGYYVYAAELCDLCKRGHWLCRHFMENIKAAAYMEAKSFEDFVENLMSSSVISSTAVENLERAGYKPALNAPQNPDVEVRDWVSIVRESVKNMLRQQLRQEAISQLLMKYVLVGRIVRTPYYTDKDKQVIVGTYCWSGKHYYPCILELEKEAYDLLKSAGRAERWGESLRRNIESKIEMETLEKMHHEGAMAISFENIVLDWEELKQGNMEAAFKEHDPELWIYHHIPWNLDVETLRRAIAAKDPQELENIFREKSPRALEIFKAWVNDRWPLLLEIIGYTLYPRYSFHKAIMLIGEGSSGKSTFLRLVRTILGSENVSSISIQELTTDRFAAQNLYRKLANIFPDLPRSHIYNSGVFKALTGEDRICVDRKFKERICFENYAKMLFSANELPEPPEDTLAWWRRWLLIEFPNQFPRDDSFFEKNFKKEDIETIIALSIAAFLKVLERKGFSYEESEASYRLRWLLKSDPVFRFIEEKLKTGELVRHPSLRISRDELYQMYTQYCSEADDIALDKKTFTERLERLGYKKIRPQNRVWLEGIGKPEKGITVYAENPSNPSNSTNTSIGRSTGAGEPVCELCGKQRFIKPVVIDGEEKLICEECMIKIRREIKDQF